MVKNEGLKICSIHAPFGAEADLSSPKQEISSMAWELFKRCIEASLFLNAPSLIFHPTSFRKIDNLDIRKKVLVEQISKLLECLGKEKLKLAIENLDLGLANTLLRYALDNLTVENFGLCYDSSHDNLLSNPLSILKKYSNLLFTTHISDNRGREDDHLLPFEGTFPWKDFCKLFSMINFDGIFLLEVEMRKSTIQNPKEFLREAFLRGEKLLKQSDKL